MKAPAVPCSARPLPFENLLRLCHMLASPPFASAGFSRFGVGFRFRRVEGAACSIWRFIVHGIICYNVWMLRAGCI